MNEAPGAPPADRRDRRPLALAILAVGVVAVFVVAGAVSMLTAAQATPPPELRPRVADVVASVDQVGAAWDVGLASGRHVTLDSSVHDVFRPVSGAPMSPPLGALMLADALPPTWVAFSLGGSGQAADECFEIHQPAIVRADRLLFTSGLSVPIGTWRREPQPSPGATLAGACLDRSGKAVDSILGLGFRPVDTP